MESEVKLSIIIPVFNGEKYIIRCLDSIFSQWFDINVEVIVVDDASTDNSLLILKDYQIKVPRFRIIEQVVNKSLAVARLTGMNSSIGDYILHVDQDDWLLPGSIESMYQNCVLHNVDVLVFNYVIENSNGKRSHIHNIKNELVTSDKALLQNQFLQTAWNKLVKRSITLNLIYGNERINCAEDLLYTTEILLNAQKICLLPEFYYVYFQNTDSITHATKPDTFINSQIIILEQIRLITLKYSATSQFIDTILNKIEKHIYFAICQSAFIFKEREMKNNELIRAFRLFPEMTLNRINNLERSISNKYYSLLPVYSMFGIATVVTILYHSVKMFIKKLYIYINNILRH